MLVRPATCCYGRLRTPLALLFFTTTLLLASAAEAVFSQTFNDLGLAHDQLRYNLKSRPELQKQVLPLLVASPKTYWSESQKSLEPLLLRELKKLFSKPGQLISCPDCSTPRLYQAEMTSIFHGPVHLAELSNLVVHSQYGRAKSLLLVEETPAGLSYRILNIADGRILFSTLADSTHSLDDARPYLNYARELERRKRGESLSYTFINLGLLRSIQLQIEFLEQWGSRNQHLSGFIISLVNPEGGLGFTYHYMVPRFGRKLNLYGAAMLPLSRLAEVEESNSTELTYQVGAQYVISRSYGIYVAATSEGNVSAGFTFFNPVWIPVLF